MSATAFVSRACDLTAHFRFEPKDGTWELAEALVSDDAFELGFQPLVGTWEGTFVSQGTQQAKEGKGGACLAARETGLEVDILKATVGKDGVALVEGTLSGVAHLHEPVEGNVEAHRDDELLEGLPFAGTLRGAGVGDGDAGDADGMSGGIVFDCVAQDLAHGTISLTLGFGGGDDPDAATATLVSEHPYQETFLLFLTYDAVARFEDRFALTKVG